MRSRNTTSWQRIAVIAPMALAAQATVGIAHAQPYPPGPPGGSTSTSAPCAGCALTTTWTGYKPDSPITLTLFSAPVGLGSVTTNAAGPTVDVITIPSDTEPGEHTITGTGVAPNGSPVTESIHITVTEPAGNQGSTSNEQEGSHEHESSDALAHTGAEVLVPTGIGVGAVAIGTLIVLSVRRRSAASSTDQ